ncbi:Alg9-like mannosyltransferase family-domain-containing protein [Phycomyces nitens]|nr:Alg9-like mannosyltransferase family-domain-containing protein [Phycomyces nitens]
MKTRQAILYVAFLWFRWLVSSLPGYLHPDEFFQSPEITAGPMLGVETSIPWEYSPAHASRSIVIPFLTTGIPFWFLRKVEMLTNGDKQIIGTLSIFLTERTASFILSLLIDFSIIHLYKSMKKDYLLPLFLVASSQVALVYYTRTFSNTIEAIILCLSLASYTSFTKKGSLVSAYFLGFLLCLGIFTRITFGLYGLPIGLGFLWHALKGNSSSKPSFVGSVFSFVLGASLIASVCILADSIYFGALTVTVDDKPLVHLSQIVEGLMNGDSFSLDMVGDFIITPLNNLKYNMNVDNLATHGIHPRYVHSVVNFPLLFGPLAVASLMDVTETMVLAGSTLFSNVYYVALGSIITAMVGLSIFPHQEARFLVPMLVPLVIVYTWNKTKLTKMFWVIWIIFNVITTFIFGVLHQGGIVPTMSYLQQQSTNIHGCEKLASGDIACQLDYASTSFYSDYNITTHILFFKTYMAPQHLLGYPTEWKDTSNIHVQVKNFGSDIESTEKELEHRSGVLFHKDSHTKHKISFAQSQEAPASFERTLLVAPMAATLPRIHDRRYLLLTSYNPHVSFDDMKATTNQTSQIDDPAKIMSLNVWLILSDVDAVN